jgi:pimeloyl-ACP methyl ester carboxylesterase
MVTLTLLACSTLLVVFAVIVSAGQDSMIFLPRAYQGPELASFEKAGGQKLRFQTAAGAQTAFLSWPGKEKSPHRSPQHYWILFGGNGALALDWTSLVEQCRSPETAFLLVDYPSYGLCNGKPSRKAIEANIEGAVAACAAHLGVTEKVITSNSSVLGHSLGAAVALVAAEKFGVKEIILFSPFTSLKELAKRYVPAPLTLLLRHRYDNQKSLAGLSGTPGMRVTVYHGSDDQLIPVSMGRDLAAEFPDIVEFHEIPGAGHNDIIFRVQDQLVDRLGSRRDHADQ